MPSSFDSLHSSHRRLQTILSCGKHGSASSIFSKTLILLETLKTLNQPRVEFYHAGQNDYLPVFCFEGLFLDFVEITYRFPSLKAPFSSQVKNV